MKIRKIVNLKNLLGLLIMALFICLFFSKTIYTNNLPKVVAELPRNVSDTESSDSEKKILIPVKAMFDDGDGKFVFQIKKRQGILGDEYYLYKLKIQTRDFDDEHKIVTSGMEYLEPVVLSSSKRLNDGMLINVLNENDFFVDY